MKAIRSRYGEEVLRIYGSGENVPPPILMTYSLRGPQIVALHVVVEEKQIGLLEPIPPEDTFIVAVSSTGASQYELFCRGRPLPSGGFAPNSMRIGHLIDGAQSRVYQPFECVCLLIRRASLDAYTNEEDYRRVENLSCPYGIVDTTMAHLTTALLPFFTRPQEVSALFADHVGLAITDHLVTRYGKISIPSTAIARGGLAASKIRLVQEMLMNDLKGDMRVADIARECGISRQHLISSFRRTTGCTPHKWLQHVRVKQAKDMMKNTKYNIEYIAAQCGFSGQGHLTSVFRAIEGTTPAVWRRQN